MDILDQIRRWIAQLTIVALALVPLAIVLQVLFGKEVPFVPDAVGNLVGLINSFDQGFIGLIALAIVIWLFGLIRDSVQSSGSATATSSQAGPLPPGSGDS